MVAAAAREIADREVVFVGMRLPLLGFLLAKSTHAPHAVGVYELGVIRETVAPEPILTMGDLPNLYRAQWLADTADLMGLLQQGLVDVSFIGGAQVDRFGNLNTSYIGSPDKPDKIETRLPTLLTAIRSVLSPHPLGVLLSCHTPELTPIALDHLLRQEFSPLGGRVDHGEMLLRGPQPDTLAVPSGSFALWTGP